MTNENGNDRKGELTYRYQNLQLQILPEQTSNLPSNLRILRIRRNSRILRIRIRILRIGINKKITESGFLPSSHFAWRCSS